MMNTYILRQALYIPRPLYIIREPDDSLILIKYKPEDNTLRTATTWQYSALPHKWRKMFKLKRVPQQYLIKAEDIYPMLNAIRNFMLVWHIKQLNCTNLEEQNKRFFPLEHIYFAKFSSDSSKFVVFDKYFQLLNYNLITPENINKKINYIAPICTGSESLLNGELKE